MINFYLLDFRFFMSLKFNPDGTRDGGVSSGSASAQRGRAVFSMIGCALCHTPQMQTAPVMRREPPIPVSCQSVGLTLRQIISLAALGSPQGLSVLPVAFNQRQRLGRPRECSAARTEPWHVVLWCRREHGISASQTRRGPILGPGHLLGYPCGPSRPPDVVGFKLDRWNILCSVLLYRTASRKLCKSSKL